MATTSHYPISVLKAARTRGQIGMGFCPGRAPYSWLGSFQPRDLGHDIGTIARWSPRVVLTAMQQSELVEQRLEEMPSRFRSANIDWQLLPFPSDGLWAEFERYWAALTPMLCAHLAAGARIFVHCQDGIHRSGFVAARLLIDLGCRAQDAINRVRAAMPGSIDVPGQEDELLLYSREGGQLPDLSLAGSGQQELELDVGEHRLQAAVIPLLKPSTAGVSDGAGASLMARDGRGGLGNPLAKSANSEFAQRRQ